MTQIIQGAKCFVEPPQLLWLTITFFVYIGLNLLHIQYTTKKSILHSSSAIRLQFCFVNIRGLLSQVEQPQGPVWEFLPRQNLSPWRLQDLALQQHLSIATSQAIWTKNAVYLNSNILNTSVGRFWYSRPVCQLTLYWCSVINWLFSISLSPQKICVRLKAFT